MRDRHFIKKDRGSKIFHNEISEDPRSFADCVVGIKRPKLRF